MKNKTQQDKDWTYTEARYETPTYETTNDSTVNPNTTSTEQNNTAVAIKSENGVSIESSKNADNKPDAKQMSIMLQISKCDMAQ